jgi:uncharacterized membrane protein YfcA
VDALDLAVAAAGCFAAALLGSAMGLVLGSLHLPAVLVASGNAASAAGTNIAVSAVSALVGGIEHARAGRVERIVAWMAPQSVVAAFVGGVSSGVVPNGVLLGLIAAVLVYSGLDLLVGIAPAPDRPREPRTVAAVAGTGIGLLWAGRSGSSSGRCGCRRSSRGSA